MQDITIRIQNPTTLTRRKKRHIAPEGKQLKTK